MLKKIYVSLQFWFIAVLNLQISPFFVT